jgi:lactate racemase
MTAITLPYGRSTLSATLPEPYRADLISLAPLRAVTDPGGAVEAAMENLLGDVTWSDFAGVRSAAIAINDKTRPAPHQHLLPPLLRQLESIGLPPAAIRLIIATGTHPPMPPEEFTAVVPPAVLARYPVLCHDADDAANLVHLGTTGRGTPVWINRAYLEAELRLVVGNIEPHQFQGFSGGVKSAAIGLAGRATVNHNHAMMDDPAAQLGRYADNPTRQDVEEMGRMIGVHLALNTILNDQKEIVQVLAGTPMAVMEAGIPLVERICQVAVNGRYDLVIASPGGHPKDINLYQAQKGLAHASLIARDGGIVILAAACPEGTGSRGYEEWVQQLDSHEAVLARFAGEGFRVGPHKAFQIARDAVRVKLLFISGMEPAFVRQLLLTPMPDLATAVNHALAHLPPHPRIALMPKANATIPLLAG